jgi:serine/threonine protein kinase
LLSALEVLEQHMLRHRDLKPYNIVLRAADDLPVLIDFSFAITANTSEAPAGSIGYLPPEAPSAAQPPESSDRYAAAVILHQVLTGRRPDEPSPTEVGDITTPLRNVLLRAVEADPTKRFPNAEDFRRALEAARRAPEIVSPIGADNLVRQINPWVDAVRGLYRDSASGNADNRGLDSQFARVTYVPTALDERLLPAILRDRPPAVFLSGNPGDGKTAFLERVRDALEVSGAVKHQQDLTVVC